MPQPPSGSNDRTGCPNQHLHRDYNPANPPRQPTRRQSAMLRFLSPDILRAMADARWCSPDERAAFLAEAERQDGGGR